MLYLKPRNTLVVDGVVAAPTDGEVEIGAATGIVFGRAACRVAAADVRSVIAGCVLVVDCSVPHDDVYRPSVRLRARDRSCLIGPSNRFAPPPCARCRTATELLHLMRHQRRVSCLSAGAT